jgi:hypothetical protein
LPLSSASGRHCRPTPGRFVIVPVPNITHVLYGRDVGYIVERIVLDDNIEAISATQLRRLGTLALMSIAAACSARSSPTAYDSNHHNHGSDHKHPEGLL